jgi:guanosine-3',5'-bis(diphosphate) 3'-pyrophosphohydrolase
MMRQYELVERVGRYNPQTNDALLNKAYVYAMRAHGSQTRASGDPYFSHPLEVAGILTDLKLDDATIVAALLHDTVEDTDATIEEINGLFGADIAALVDGLTKIKKLDRVTREATQAENLRKLLLAMARDVRVLLIKLADRLHNMRTLGYVPEHKRQRVAEETMELYAPLAGRMGIQWMRDELEDLAFITLQPEAYAMITGRLTSLRVKSDTLISEITEELSDLMDMVGIEAEIYGREKRPYSIWRKLQRKSLSFEKLSDIFGFRLIVDTVEECYRVMGLVHTNWPMVPGRFKDYISTPKQNDYRSIHTTVRGPGHQLVELQIRTRRMHQVAEYGIAAHALYKDDPGIPTDVQGDTANGHDDAHDDNGHHENGLVLNGGSHANGAGQGGVQQAGHHPGKGLNGHGGTNGARHSADREVLLRDTRAYGWLRDLVDRLSDREAAEDFLEHTKLDLFQDQVFCFTPKSRLIALPRGATAIDFAYAVHTDVGNNAIGCKINGRLEPLISPLSNGDEVEILTSANQTPPPAWESVAKTGKAKQSIRRATRMQAREQYSGLGRNIVERAVSRAGKSYSDEKLQAVIGRLGHSEVEDALAAVGRGELGSDSVLKALYPDYKEEARSQKTPAVAEEGWFGLRRAMGLKFKLPVRSSTRERASAGEGSSAIPIRGIRGDLPVRFAPDGGAVPGDRIVGIVTPGQGITIYPIQSPELKNFDDEPERWIDVRWDIPDEGQERFPARMGVRVLNEPGVLALVAQIIGEQDANIDAISMTRRETDFTEMVIDLEVWHLKHLNAIFSLLKSADVVNSVWRVNG